MVNGVQEIEQLNRPPGLPIIVQSAGGKHRFVVIEVGRGIFADQKQLIFNTFFSTKPCRVAVGCAICRNCIEVQGGKLR